MHKLIDIQQFHQFDNLELIAKEVVEGFITGLHRSPFHGFSVEFAEHRQYNQGESTKHIDWKLYARSGRLYVKQYEEETNLRCQIVIDHSSSMLFPYEKGKKQQYNKLAFSVYCSAALIYLLRKQRDAVGLTLFSDQIEFHSEARLSSVHAELMYSKLAELLDPEKYELKKTTNTVEALHALAENIHKRSLVIIFSDMVESEQSDELFSALQHLRYNKHEVLLFHVTDKKQEQDFDFRNRPYRFVDLESGEHLKFSPHELKSKYKKAMQAYFDELKVKCGQYHIDLAEADINDDFKQVLFSYLVKRKKLF
ncbi:MAG: hypothetical protein A2W90_11490 [Bacteroidetes bacterium GWF2_42_66]|nr:MAG: hypothetical protein A2W92_13495 [Bacteroidetes bacterium GWA2_42_15]OFY01801.1 MAG: hypothetical protein A2W89_23080 [Bacteroidetes bacterium GWE2_42_39]OFY44905.1 MAG: hypothetical protein A2W90_11490 [Bacteroidetes bacterium GWF2_42_66]HBL76032.1 DUF58 domain-containing protein [Prolixibacteraceae bacterium]HCR89657.1 DUF58 domain-containing protein [Prolixibacteraceae bacterium]